MDRRQFGLFVVSGGFLAGCLENGDDASFTYSTNACTGTPGLIVGDDGTLESIWSEC